MDKNLYSHVSVVSIITNTDSSIQNCMISHDRLSGSPPRHSMILLLQLVQIRGGLVRVACFERKSS